MYLTISFIPKGEVFHLKYVVGTGEELQYKLESSLFIFAFDNLPESIPDSFRNFFEPIN